MSSTNWLNRQINDQYRYAAQQEGYRSRAAYKLLEINNKFSIFDMNGIVLDLGSSPGSWSQVASKHCKKVIAIDIRPMKEIPKVIFVKCNFTQIEQKDEIYNMKFNVILSDMSHSTSGNNVTDHLRIIALSKEVLDFAKLTLKTGGTVVTKIFHGNKEKEIYLEFKNYFTMVKYYKPNASRKDSSEIYLVAKNFSGKK
ncbi:MAG: RlmE family RNA methyltransferase [Rickettsiaceae bacterium H1]|nr:RlmE family RNA methyltransferase [Rickettsiaceae bacterium H1]